MTDQRPPNGGLHVAGPDDAVQVDGPMDWAMAHLSAADAYLGESAEVTTESHAMLQAMTGIGWALVASMMPAPRWATPCEHPADQRKTMGIIEHNRARTATICQACGQEVGK